MSKSLTERLRPQSLDDIRGHPTAIGKLQDWIENWEPGDEAQLLYGPAGTGKSSTAEALANDYDLNLVEINASSARTKDDIKDIARQIKVGSKGEPQELILVDETDSLSSSVSPLKDALEEPNTPVILTANDKYKVPNSVENWCKCRKFNLQKRSKKKAIREIAEEEGIELTKKEIGMLSTRQGLRDALNDLEKYGRGNSEIGWDERETESGPFKSTRNIIQGKKYVSPEMYPEDVVMWLDENLSGQLEGLEQAMAYDALSRADKWIGRANDTGNYHWWAYAGEIAEQCANLRLTEPYDGYVHINVPAWFQSKGDTFRSNNSTVKLYKTLKREDSGIFEFSGDYFYFKQVLLPFIRALNDESKYKFIHYYKLEENQAEELDIDYSDYKDWKESGFEEKEDEAIEVETEDEDEDGEEEVKGALDF